MAEEKHHDHHLFHHHKDEDQLIDGTTYNYLGGEEAGSGYGDQTKTVYNSGGDSFGQTGSAYSTEGVGSEYGQTKIDQHSGGGYGQTKTDECSGGGYGQTKTDDYSDGDCDNTKADECPSDGYAQSVGTTYSSEKAGTGGYGVTGTDTYITTEGAGGYGSQTSGGMETTKPRKEEYEKEEMHHKNKERVGELGAAAAGALAMYEKHVPKEDPEHEHRHKIGEEVAAAAAVGSGGYAFHEYHEKEVAKEEEKMAEGKKHRHLFG